MSEGNRGEEGRDEGNTENMGGNAGKQNGNTGNEGGNAGNEGNVDSVEMRYTKNGEG